MGTAKSSKLKITAKDDLGFSVNIDIAIDTGRCLLVPREVAELRTQLANDLSDMLRRVRFARFSALNIRGA